jgi:hypothetical protein
MTRKTALAKAQACLEKAEESIGGVGKAYESWSLLSDRYVMLANEISRDVNNPSV